jgi:Dyp-type peroxidase family
MSATIDVGDVQSLVFSGHGGLRASAMLELDVREEASARSALLALGETAVAFGFGAKERKSSVQLLLTARGVRALGGTDDDLAGFGRQFTQGMVTTQRSRALGDAEENDPATWTWSDARMDALLIVYAMDRATCDEVAADLAAKLGSGWVVRPSLAIDLPEDGREPFGFKDGLSGTRVDIGDGSGEKPGVALLPPGEVLLGCRNAAGIVPAAPALGEGGSLVVLRQLEQDVAGFWEFWRRQARDEQEAVWLAAKAVGRWPNGMPVDGSVPGPEPAYDEAVALAPLDFGADARGLKCPFGAHIRRANPRDGLGDDPAASLENVRHHRILRRGRMYGPPVPPDWYPMCIRTAKTAATMAPSGNGPAKDAASGRGLLFVVLCADIARQFEFIQQTWLNNPKFSDLYDEVDPIAAGRGLPGDSGRFSIPRSPLRCRINALQRWVRVRGGGYFLLPGKRALRRFLAEKTGPVARQLPARAISEKTSPQESTNGAKL